MYALLLAYYFITSHACNKAYNWRTNSWLLDNHHSYAPPEDAAAEQVAAAGQNVQDLA